MESAGPGQRVRHDAGIVASIAPIRRTRFVISDAARREDVITQNAGRGAAPSTIRWTTLCVSSVVGLPERHRHYQQRVGVTGPVRRAMLEPARRCSGLRLSR